MNSTSLLPLLLALGLASGCGKSDANAASGDPMKSLGEAAQGLGAKAQEAMKGLQDLDVTKLTGMDPAKLKELASGAMGSIASQLGSVKDVASAENAKKLLEPVLGKLDGLKAALGGSLPDLDSVKNVLSGLTSKFAAGSDVMNVLQPIVDKLKALVG